MKDVLPNKRARALLAIALVSLSRLGNDTDHYNIIVHTQTIMLVKLTSMLFMIQRSNAEKVAIEPAALSVVSSSEPHCFMKQMTGTEECGCTARFWGCLPNTCMVSICSPSPAPAGDVEISYRQDIATMKVIKNDFQIQLSVEDADDGAPHFYGDDRFAATLHRNRILEEEAIICGANAVGCTCDDDVICGKGCVYECVDCAAGTYSENPAGSYLTAPEGTTCDSCPVG